MSSNRSETIVNAVEQMDALIDQRSALQRQIRALKRSLKIELGINPANFEIALRLRSLARQQKSKDLEDIREITAALGLTAMPATAEQANPSPLNGGDAGSTSTSQRILTVMRRVGSPLPAKQIAHLVGNDIAPSNVSGWLTYFKKRGLVSHIGTEWMIAKP